MAITTVIQQTTVDTVGSVVVTDVAQDAVTNNWTRQIRVYGPADQTTGQPVLIFTLQVEAQSQQSQIELTAPSAQF